MNLLETRTSSFSGRSSPSFLRSPSSSTGGGKVSSNASTITYVLGFAACLLLFITTYHERSANRTTVVVSRRQWKDVGGVTRDTALEMLLLKKEQELETVRAQLQHALSGNAIKESNMQAQEAAIRLLQQRSDKERTARSKAQFALSERLQQISKCEADVDVLEKEVLQCSSDLKSIIEDPRRRML